MAHATTGDRHQLSEDGQALVEVEPPGRALVRDEVRLCRRDAAPGPWFDWAWVGSDAIDELALLAGFGSCSVRMVGNRHVAHLEPLAESA